MSSGPTVADGRRLSLAYLSNAARNVNLLLLHLSALSLFCLLPGLVRNCCAAEPSLRAEHHEYIEQTADQTTIFHWDLAPGEPVTVISSEEAADYVNICDASGSTLEWRMKNDHTDITARREANQIRLTGMVNGQRLDNVLQIDAAPWYQPLSFSLRAFVLSGKTEVEFWTIRPDRLTPVKLRAEKDGVDAVPVGGGPETAQRVRVCVSSGIMSYLWSCCYWFRLDDGVFLKYEGTHGPPGTPKTTILLNCPPAGKAVQKR